MNGTAYYINDLDIDNGEHRLDTTEKMVDIWYDGRPIYEKLFILDEAVDIGVSQGGTLIADPTSYNFDSIVKCVCISGTSSAVCYPEAYIATDPGVQPLKAINNYPFLVKYFILQYTKANDTTLPDGIGRGQSLLADPIHTYVNDPLAKKFIGKWVDGKNIYETVFEITFPDSSVSSGTNDIPLPNNTTPSDYHINSVVNGWIVFITTESDGIDGKALWNNRNQDKIRVKLADGWNNISKAYLVLQYTLTDEE
jgi:hypothetical protein